MVGPGKLMVGHTSRPRSGYATVYEKYLKELQLYHCFSEVGSHIILVNPYYYVLLYLMISIYPVPYESCASS